MGTAGTAFGREDHRDREQNRIINQSLQYQQVMGSRIPPTDSDFHTYITTTKTALGVGTPDTATRLGLTSGEKSAWEAYEAEWVPTYALYGDEDMRTKTVKDNKNRIKREFTAFANPLLTRMSVSPNITAGDRNTFHLPERKDPSERPGISERPALSLVSTGGGVVVVRVRTVEDGSKPSMHPDADLIELRYVLQAVDVAAPTSIRELTETAITSRAKSELKLGDTAEGRILYIAARYVNKVDATKNSPWCAIQRQVVA
jgi:hypothetical protein